MTPPTPATTTPCAPWTTIPPPSPLLLLLLPVTITSGSRRKQTEKTTKTLHPSGRVSHLQSYRYLFSYNYLLSSPNKRHISPIIKDFSRGPPMIRRGLKDCCILTRPQVFTMSRCCFPVRMSKNTVWVIRRADGQVWKERWVSAQDKCGDEDMGSASDWDQLGQGG